jgi:hypothetical protein
VLLDLYRGGPAASKVLAANKTVLYRKKTALTCDLAQLARAASLAGNKKNLEIMLNTQIIDGEPGTHKMEAAYFW